MKLAFAAIAATLVAGTANAGGYVAPTVDPVITPVVVPIVAPVSDWTGFYAGLQYGQGSADQSFAGTELSDDFDGYGVHAGYNRDFGQFVLGGELDYNRIDLDSDDDKGDMVRLRARAGYDMGRFLPYVTLGAANIDYNDISETAVSYGIGADFKVTERVTVGAEYTRQDFDDVEGIDGLNIDTDMVQLRAAYRF